MQRLARVVLGGRGAIFRRAQSPLQIVAIGLPQSIPSGFTSAANGANLASMDWHRTPRDDAWKEAHLAMVEGLGIRVQLGCDWCQHHVMIAPRQLADRHGLDMRTPLLTISRALRCTRCGERKGYARLAPHGYGR